MTSVLVKDVSLNYGSVQVLKSLNIDIPEGEFLVLLGPSGCGKSTLLNCIAGLLDVSSGQIFINGRNVTWEEPKDRGIGMVFQSYALYPQMSVEKNLSFGLRIAKLPAAEIRKRVDRAAEILQIGPLLDRKPAELSGGQRQRVAMGRALVRDVDVFLFDEPLSNLDAKLRSELRVELKRLHQRLGNTMIYVTHDQIEALTLADRIAVMKNGVIQQLDAPQTIYNRPKNLYVAGFLGSPAMNFLNGSIEQHGAGFAFNTGEASVDLGGYVPDGAGLRAGPAILGVRPEHILVGNGNASLTAEVDLVETMGSDSLVWLTHAGQPISARVESTRRHRNGEKLGVALDLTIASLFDVETQERL